MESLTDLDLVLIFSMAIYMKTKSAPDFESGHDRLQHLGLITEEELTERGQRVAAAAYNAACEAMMPQN